MEVQDISEIINDIEATPNKVGAAGCQLFLLMCGEKKSDVFDM